MRGTAVSAGIGVEVVMGAAVSLASDGEIVCTGLGVKVTVAVADPLVTVAIRVGVP